MSKFFQKNGKIYYDDTEQGLGYQLSNTALCHILNSCDDHICIRPKDCIDFNKYKCELCGKKQIGHNGSWNQNPYIFFCSKKCHKMWILKKLEKEFNNNMNKRIYE